MPSSRSTIGMITWDYLQPKGGLGRSVQWIVRALRAGGISVRVVAPHGDPAQDQSILPWTQRLPTGHLIFSLLLATRLHSLIKKMNPQALLFPTGPGGIFLWRRSKSIPMIAIAYHTYLDQARLVPGQRWKKIFIPFERRTYRAADHILCFSEDTAQTLMHDYHIEPSRIQVLPHAIDVVQWSGGVEKEDNLCVCIARLERRKGVDVLLHAWPSVIEESPSAKLVIVGRGWEEKRIDRLVHHVGNSVTRYDGLPEDDLKALIRRASIVVCPSYLEGFGLSAAEAMAAGAAVIASDCPGLRSLVRHNETGLLVPAGNEKSLTEAIILALSDADLRWRLGKAAQGEARERFNMYRANEMLVRKISEVIESEHEFKFQSMQHSPKKYKNMERDFWPAEIR